MKREQVEATYIPARPQTLALMARCGCGRVLSIIFMEQRFQQSSGWSQTSCFVRVWDRKFARGRCDRTTETGRKHAFNDAEWYQRAVAD